MTRHKIHVNAKNIFDFLMFLFLYVALSTCFGIKNSRKMKTFKIENYVDQGSLWYTMQHKEHFIASQKMLMKMSLNAMI